MFLLEHAVFVISVGCGKSKWNVERRYSAFFELRNALESSGVGSRRNNSGSDEDTGQLPEIPPKTWFTKLGPEFLTERTKGLNAFLVGLLLLRNDKTSEHKDVRSFLDLDRTLPDADDE